MSSDLKTTAVASESGSRFVDYENYSSIYSRHEDEDFSIFSNNVITEHESILGYTKSSFGPIPILDIDDNSTAGLTSTYNSISVTKPVSSITKPSGILSTASTLTTLSESCSTIYLTASETIIPPLPKPGNIGVIAGGVVGDSDDVILLVIGAIFVIRRTRVGGKNGGGEFAGGLPILAPEQASGGGGVQNMNTNTSSSLGLPEIVSSGRTVR
ncbi:hypothetical protein BS50DRAFT_582208 [Corynespora cassiicola Philippines]|uniref:Uncharacterized protein n=1 Tax=Corynespora cassiicola Philippines TaxID=1448308 RepID=A0A2T2PD26_CORCC|nr:hypothetical protein BS50DRAFT_582208 [Corynespora cassiicola Philippines]